MENFIPSVVTQFNYMLEHHHEMTFDDICKIQYAFVDLHVAKSDITNQLSTYSLEVRIKNLTNAMKNWNELCVKFIT